MNFLNSKVPLMVPLLSNVWIKARSNNDDFYLALNEMSGIQPRNEIIQKFHHLESNIYVLVQHMKAIEDSVLMLMKATKICNSKCLHEVMI